MTARIDYLSWPATEIAGGIKISFRHVEALRQAGLDAVIATPGAEPPGWFQSAAPIIDVAQASRDDILVFPENHYALLDAFAAWPNRKLVFCQNQFMVVRGLGGLGGRRDYAEFGVSGILCAGRSVADFCRLRFPSMPIAIVPVGIDQTLFRPQRDKKLQIAFAAHKRPLEAAFIWDLFCAKPRVRLPAVGRDAGPLRGTGRGGARPKRGLPGVVPLRVIFDDDHRDPGQRLRNRGLHRFRGPPVHHGPQRLLGRGGRLHAVRRAIGASRPLGCRRRA